LIKDTIQIKIRVNKKDIVFVDMIFKAYEGLAMVTISKSNKGLLCLDFSEENYYDIMEILRNLKEKIFLEIVIN
jgi:hypothetical protein